jgi:hypothetical protein
LSLVRGRISCDDRIGRGPPRHCQDWKLILPCGTHCVWGYIVADLETERFISELDTLQAYRKSLTIFCVGQYYSLAGVSNPLDPGDEEISWRDTLLKENISNLPNFGISWQFLNRDTTEVEASDDIANV